MPDIFDEFKEYSVAEFFKKNRHMLGFGGKIKSLTTIIHEYITNSLDACEEFQVLPDIKIELTEIEKDTYKVVVQDNGPGMPKHIIGKALGKLLAGTKFHRLIQQRGQQGIGAAGCTMYAKLTTGKPIHVISAHKGRLISCDITIDFKKNEPVITNFIEQEGVAFHGTIIEGYFGDVKFDKSEYGVYEYVRRTALANPHANITLIVNGEKYEFKRTSWKLPPKPKEAKPHPLGLTPHDLLEYAKRTKAQKLYRFLMNDINRVSAQKITELKQLLPTLNFEKDPKALTWEEAKALVKVMKKLKWISPPTDVVYPIGEEQIKKSLLEIVKPEIVVTRTRSPKIYRGGIPYVVEVGIAYGGEVKHGIYRLANRVPLLFDASACAITQAVKSIDWKRYNIDDFENSPILVFVNLSSVFVPYVSAGKQAISPEDEIVQEIKNAVMEAARDIKVHIRRKYKARELEKKKKALLRYVSYVSSDLAALAGVNQSTLEEKLKSMIEHKYSLTSRKTEAAEITT